MPNKEKLNLPKIAITMGDPAGVGAEVILKALSLPIIYDHCKPVVFGNTSVLKHFADLLKINNFKFHEISNVDKVDSIKPDQNNIYVYKIDDSLSLDKIEFGKVSKECGNAAYLYLETATKFALANKIDAITTAPLCKESLRLAGYPFPGHTEILAYLTNTKNYAMMFQGGGMKIVLYTIHIPIADVPKKINAKNIFKLIELTNKEMIRFGIGHPKIAVCGLNPHAGESGVMGKEEEQHIIPAILAAQKKGINAAGPFPADTIFFKAVRKEYDVVIAMYHDQGLIAVKTLDFYKSVNITIGLPIIRTSVDHGTAFDIVGKGVADPSSLIEAIRTAAFMSRNKN